MVDVEDRVVVQRRDVGELGTVEAEIVSASVAPPGLEGPGVEVGAVSAVVEPQTETRSGQSERPDLGVLSMTADGGRQPLPAQVLGDGRVGPGEGVVAVPDHVAPTTSRCGAR